MRLSAIVNKMAFSGIVYFYLLNLINPLLVHVTDQFYAVQINPLAA